MPTMRSMLDPITHKTYDYVTDNSREEHLLTVLDAACRNQCPPNVEDYVCEREDAIEDNELLQCAKCYRLWSAKVAGPGTNKANRLAQAINMAVTDQCPADTADMVCKATEDEDTSEEVCAMCIQRWATIPFAKFRG